MLPIPPNRSAASRLAHVVCTAALSTACLSPPLKQLASPRVLEPYSAVPAPCWTALFDRRHGWTGADGVYAIPLSGDERPGSGASTRTLLTFGDTFVGSVDADGRRSSDTTMVRNTQALLTGGEPREEALEFFWSVDSEGTPRAMVEPGTAEDELLWQLDGAAIDGELVLFAMRLAPADTAFGVEIVGIQQLVWAIAPGRPFVEYERVETPLFRGLDTYGRAVLANTAEAGAPRPDGFVYVYGLREEPLDKQLLAARVPRGRVKDFSAYEFWDGRAWSGDIAAAAPLVRRLSSEFSVSAVADGRVLLTYQQDDFLGSDVSVRLGEGPVGPFGDAVPVYAIPEGAKDENLFCYGAKAHPHLSSPDRLLISYHVNSFEFWQHFRDAGIYRPRFVELPLRDGSSP